MSAISRQQHAILYFRCFGTCRGERKRLDEIVRRTLTL